MSGIECRREALQENKGRWKVSGCIMGYAVVADEVSRTSPDVGLFLRDRPVEENRDRFTDWWIGLDDPLDSRYFRSLWLAAFGNVGVIRVHGFKWKVSSFLILRPWPRKCITFTRLPRGTLCALWDFIPKWGGPRGARGVSGEVWGFFSSRIFRVRDRRRGVIWLGTTLTGNMFLLCVKNVIGPYFLLFYINEEHF